MRFKAEEITAVLRKELEDFRSTVDVAEVGTILEVGDGMARIYGLDKAAAGEMLEFENGVRAQVFNLEEGSIGAIVLGDDTSLKEGMTVRRLKSLLEVPVGMGLVGRVVDPLGNPIDGKGPIDAEGTRPVDLIAPGIADRQPVKEPLQTGIKAIDSMTPIGRGQRELIIGDRKTGKTAIAIDTIINQKDSDVICVYVAIGQKESTVAGVVEVLTAGGRDGLHRRRGRGRVRPGPAPVHRAVLGLHDGRAPDVQAPQAHAVRVRRPEQAGDGLPSALAAARRPPGREAYPGDVFYLHSRLLERAVKLSDDLGAGSLTALPIIETQEGEVSAYIPTNVISITDGQIYLQPDLFRAGVRPAVDVGISVSRVGGAAQIKAMKHKKVAGGLRLTLAAFRELEAFAQLGTELDASTQAQLDLGRVMVEILKQGQHKPMNVIDQVIIIYAGNNGYLNEVPVDKVHDYETAVLDYVRANHAAFRERFAEAGDLTEEIEAELVRILDAFNETYVDAKASD